MKMYQEYLSEREATNIIYREDRGFITWKFIDDAVYIVDVYVVPQERKSGLATALASEVYNIAYGEGMIFVIGSVDVKACDPTTSVEVLLAHGMRITGVSGDIIWFKKRLMEV